MRFLRAWFLPLCLGLATAVLRGDEPVPPDWTLRGKALAEMLAGLARRQGLDPEDYTSFRTADTSVGRWGACRVVTVPVDDRRYILVVQTVEWGISGEQVVLLTPEGKILDRLQCHISGRYGTLRTAVSQDAEGARVVVLLERLDRGETGNPWHNWHTLTFRGRFYTFQKRQNSEPNEWDAGLCRAVISDDRLAVVFPRLERPEEELARATSLRIRYPVGDDLKSLEVSDHARIATLFEAMTIVGTEPGLGTPLPRNAQIEVRMPGGALAQVVFLNRDMLGRTHWGRIHLESSTFHDRVASLVAAAEGRAVDLVPQPLK